MCIQKRVSLVSVLVKIIKTMTHYVDKNKKHTVQATEIILGKSVCNEVKCTLTQARYVDE